MNIEELKEAIKEVRYGRHQVTWDTEFAKKYNDALNLVLETCERVGEIGGKMPEKHIHECSPSCMATVTCKHASRNGAIDDCTLAFAGTGLSVEEIEEVMVMTKYVTKITDGDIKKYSTAIHKAQMEKLGGVR